MSQAQQRLKEQTPQASGSSLTDENFLAAHPLNFESQRFANEPGCSDLRYLGWPSRRCPAPIVVRNSSARLALWNDVLLGTDTSLYQYPFWNDPYRLLWVSPRYLAWGTQDRPLAFVSILTIGFWPLKIGLVFRGPACLQREHEIP